MIQLCGYVGMVLTITGAQMIATRRYRGFIVFVFADAFLLPPLIQAHIWSNVILVGVYFFLNFQGIKSHWKEIRNVS